MIAFNLRLLCGAVSVGFLVGAVQCYSEAQTSSHTVATVLHQNALLGALIGAVLGAVALCFDHRTACEQRDRARFKRSVQRDRSRNRF